MSIFDTHKSSEAKATEAGRVETSRINTPADVCTVLMI